MTLEFGYSQSTITRVSSNSIPLIAEKLKDWIVRPTPSDIHKNVSISWWKGYRRYLPPNKTVMTDRGFKDLSCLLEAKKCTLIRPPSVSKSTLSTKNEVKLSKQIAALRIHVEQVKNRLREFHILLPHACVDHKLIPIIDQVIVVACGLVNMQDVLIKKWTY